MTDLRTADFDYRLPPDRIAQDPAARRDDSRLMVLDRATQSIAHDRFGNLPTYVNPGDILVANRSRVIPARLWARRETGGRVELLLTRSLQPDHWWALVRPSRRIRAGARLGICGSSLHAEVEAAGEAGHWLIRFRGEGDVPAQLHRAGSMPLPLYITNTSAPDDRYQTVYADRVGSIAAPTAGLHFSSELLGCLRAHGVAVEFVTLHVGLGTFKPVVVEHVQNHRMHPEWGEVIGEAAASINRARDAGNRVVAVGTTTTRLLESAVRDGRVEAYAGETDRFIYPGYRFQAIDALITNFHLPRSSLLMLVSAFADREFVLRAYAVAVEMGYRFYSFGDAMLIV
jgi:S-adenosylmethionine:tRNA ribosyltransferase-isomerase